jgi:hypothetical protein
MRSVFINTSLPRQVRMLKPPFFIIAPGASEHF